VSNTAHARLVARFVRLGALGEAANILYWNSSVMMPLSGGAARSEQLAALAGARHWLGKHLHRYGNSLGFQVRKLNPKYFIRACHQLSQIAAATR